MTAPKRHDIGRKPTDVAPLWALIGLVGVVAVVIVAVAAWRRSILSAAERQLVGDWRLTFDSPAQPEVNGAFLRLRYIPMDIQFEDDRRCWIVNTKTTARKRAEWEIRDDVLYLDRTPAFEMEWNSPNHIRLVPKSGPRARMVRAR